MNSRWVGCQGLAYWCRSAFGRRRIRRTLHVRRTSTLARPAAKAGWLSCMCRQPRFCTTKCVGSRPGKPSGRPQKHLYLLSRPTFWLVAGSATLDPAGIVPTSHGAQFTAQSLSETEAGRRAALSWQLTKSMQWSCGRWQRVPDCGRWRCRRPNQCCLPPDCRSPPICCRGSPQRASKHVILGTSYKPRSSKPGSATGPHWAYRSNT